MDVRQPIGTCQAERSFSVLRRIKLTFNNDRRKVDRSNHDVYPPCRMFVVLITVSVCRYKRKLLYHDLCKKNLGVCFANLFCLMSQKIRLFILCSFHLCNYKAVQNCIGPKIYNVLKKAAASLVSWKKYYILKAAGATPQTPLGRDLPPPYTLPF